MAESTAGGLHPGHGRWRGIPGAPFPYIACCSDYASSMSLGEYRQVSYISRTLVGNKIDDHSDVVGASPAGAAPTTSSFST